MNTRMLLYDLDRFNSLTALLTITLAVHKARGAVWRDLERVHRKQLSDEFGVVLTFRRQIGGCDAR
jgi:hypothetical protein